MVFRFPYEGDDFSTRLLHFLNTILRNDSGRIKAVKNGLWKYKIQGKTWLVKEFSSKKKLFHQQLLTRKLKEHGFCHTYSFHPIHGTFPVLEFESRLFGVIEFIYSSRNIFTFETKENRRKALRLLQKFHQTTSIFPVEFKSFLPEFDQKDKWKNRLAEFEHNRYMLESFFPVFLLETYEEWAKWSLDKIDSVKGYFDQTPSCIIHGDVAYHNFLNGKNEELYLIDFDLIAIAPPVIEHLQIASRFLPTLKWSIDELFKHEILSMYEKDKVFLISLLYPTDVLRECNRFLKSDEKTRKMIWPYLYDLTIRQFPLRMRMMYEIFKKIDSLNTK
ncbi:phosphotransferase [Falsibacillus pallidus]|uniref:phosphotransferase n=1 Tax=Falsibacillus pallidus TaxID=493781 RepID=UPI003D953DB5